VGVGDGVGEEKDLCLMVGKFSKDIFLSGLVIELILYIFNHPSFTIFVNLMYEKDPS
jgi:hypothetical protein